MALLYKNKFWTSQRFGIFYLPEILIPFWFYDDKIVIGDNVEVPLEQIIQVETVNLFLIRQIIFKFPNPPQVALISTFLITGQSPFELEKVLELLRAKGVRISRHLQEARGIKVLLKSDEEIEKEAKRVIITYKLFLILAGLMPIIGFIASFYFK